SSAVNVRSNYAWAGCCNDPTTQADDYDSAGGLWTIGYGGTNHSYTRDPNTLAVTDLQGYNTDSNWYVYDPGGRSESVIQTRGFNKPTHARSSKSLSGLPDGNYSDLICKPFKDVRDAARRFLANLDFVRGDRIVLVTFDSSAKLIKPFGSSVE